MRPLVLSPASDSAPRTWNDTTAARQSLYHFNPSSKSRKCSRRRGVVSRRDEESCAELPDNVKLRDSSSAKVAALSLLGLVASQVSSPALARHPSSLWLITRHPALTAVRLRSYGGKARRRRRCSYCSWKLRAYTGSRLRPELASARAAAVLGKPSRVAARGAPAGAVVHGAAPGRAGSRFACPARSPRAQPLCSRCLGELGTALERYYSRCMHTRS